MTSPSVAKYGSLLRDFQSLKKPLWSGPKKFWSQTDKTNFKSRIENILNEFPYLEGYWALLAKTEFNFGNTEQAIAQFERGLKTVPYSVLLWVKYLDFLVLTNASEEKITASFLAGQEHIGSNFYSHEFWDLYLDYVKNRTSLGALGQAQILLHILENETLHQFSKYFEQLITIVRADHQLLGKLKFTNSSDLPSSGQGNKLMKDINELHLRQQERVSRAWHYEKLLKRPFFHPRSLPSEQIKAWSEYIDAAKTDPSTEALYHRALIVDAHNDKLWMDYIRWIISSGGDPVPAFEQAHVALPKDHEAVRLYWASWLEFKHQSEAAVKLFEHLASPEWPASGRFAVEYSRYLARNGEDHTKSKSILEKILSNDKIPALSKLPVLAELYKYRKDAFEAFPQKTTEYWRLYLSSAPELADEIFEKAPESSIDKEYLDVLAITNVSKYIEMDRLIHRNALEGTI